ncbi:small ribosomal subunit protein uS7m [Aulostomus maculatus]
MAASLKGLLQPWTPRVLTVRWSRYNPYYLEPEVKKEAYLKSESELSIEEKNEWDLRKHRPIKAAANNVTSSVFYDPIISKFINMIMKCGKKTLAQQIMTQTLESIKRQQVEKYLKAPGGQKEEIECNPYAIFHQAVENCKPCVGLANIKRGSITYQVPIPLKDRHRTYMALKWFITECKRDKNRRTLMHESLTEQFMQAYTKEGKVYKRKLDMHKLAEANRAYAHFRWC